MKMYYGEEDVGKPNQREGWNSKRKHICLVQGNVSCANVGSTCLV